MPVTTDLITSPELTIRPDVQVWHRALSSFALSAEAKRFREQMGLPTDRPIVMTGHQAQVWHPGILAKYIAADVVAQRLGASAAWVVVDQDTNDPFVVRYPVVGEDGRTLSARVWRIDGAERPWAERYPEVPVGLAPAVSPGVLGEDVACAGAPHVREGLAAIREAMARHAGAPNAARQVGGALTDLLTGVVRPAPTVYAMELCRTDLFMTLVEKMKLDAGRCIEAYQRAVRAYPEARVSLLHEGELPLWSIPEKAGSARKRATVGMLGAGSGGGGSACRFAPRALLMTAMLRMAGCELFIHGLGGAGADGAHGYDAITEMWIKEWLGLSLSPMAVVSATVRLNFDAVGPTPTPEQIARTRWVAHAARHHPGLLDDGAAEAARAEAMGVLARLRWKRDGESKRVKRAAYRALQETLAEARVRHAARLKGLEAEAEAAAGRRMEAEIIADRTWAFPLYEPGQIAGLREAIGARLGS